ncbi:SDR family NAD(P)-dependent oxidoreductase [Pedobacter nyackensis]|nr:3-oxoacyl-ACP reductase family protein [Pedobacter nyackensis]
MTMKELEGKVALITGSTQGIGKGIAHVLAEKGADVILNSHVEPDVVSLLSEFEKYEVSVQFIKADVSDESQVKLLFQTIEKEFGKLDILVNNAGTSQAKDIFEVELSDWDRIINTNLTSCFLCCKAAMSMMKVAGAGRIVNISSVVAHRGAQFGHLHYAATKSGMIGITKTLAKTGAPLGILVNAVAPGIIETELLLKTHQGEKLKELAAAVPLGLGKVRSVGLAVAFLCGEGGDYITGTVLDVNGGMY